MLNKYRDVLEAVFPISRDEAEYLEMFPEATHGNSISFLKREKGCVSLFVKETGEETRVSLPLRGYEEDTCGSTADGRVVVLRTLDYEIGDAVVGIFVSSGETTPEEIHRAICAGEEPLFYRAVVA